MIRFEQATKKVANDVLAEVKRLARTQYASIESTLILDPYENGREHGWKLSLLAPTRRWVAFAEYRSSDDIVVYTGRGYDDMNSGSGITEEAYRAALYFREGHHMQAATAILRALFS